MSGQPEYRGWSVNLGRWPEPAFIATHPDYDASYEGPEDGWVDNGLKADGITLEAVHAEIDAIMEEHPHFADHPCDGDGKVWNNADKTSGMWVPCECGGAK